ncbi:MAG: N-acetyltransferase family protein [Actinomycetota bacterium]|nr:N-acetyltransferase family protein [Actinomycetota bacterium]
MLIRHADPAADGGPCAAVYAPAVEDGVASFEEQAPDGEEMAARIERISVRYPWLVACDADTVLGYAYATEHRSRAAYRWAADTAVYVSPADHRRGLGAALYAALLGLLTEQGLYVACAGITLPNPASVALHERMGFVLIGHYSQIGYKRGGWRTVGWWQARLREPVDGQTPAEPGPPARLAH